MPQASQKLRYLMQEWFGDPIDDAGPLNLLRSRGYVEFHNDMLRPPTPSHTVHEIEAECIQFLIDEWDFGYETRA